MINPILDQNIFKILSLFSISPGSRFNRKDIKDKTLLNNIPLDRGLVRLRKTGILSKKGNYYSLNFENDTAKTLIATLSKEYKRLKELPFDVYLVLADLVNELSIQKGAEAYLFGSYSKLVYKEGSDIDIAILVIQKFDKGGFKRKVEKLGKTYKKNIELHFFDKIKFYKNKKDPLVKEIIKNGVRLV